MNHNDSTNTTKNHVVPVVPLWWVFSHLELAVAQFRESVAET